MLQVQTVTKDLKDFQILNDLYKSAFPKLEQTPMWFLLLRARKDFIDFFAYYDKNEFVGFTYLIHNNNLTYVLYLAVSGNNRSKGYGSLILNHIKETFSKNRIMLFIEVEDERAKNNEQRKKRKSFYISNDYITSGIIFEIHKTGFEVLIQGGDCTVQEIMTVYKKFCTPPIFAFVKPKLQTF